MDNYFEEFDEPEAFRDEEENDSGGESRDDEAKEVKEKSTKATKKATATAPRKPTLKSMDEMAKKLTGERGLRALKQLFEESTKFHSGPMNEFKNLDTLVGKYEYWAHRLYPNMRFKESIERLERLGDRRDVKHARATQSLLPNTNEEENKNPENKENNGNNDDDYEDYNEYDEVVATSNTKVDDGGRRQQMEKKVDEEDEEDADLLNQLQQLEQY